MDLGLEDRVAIVTDSARGIGAETARMLSSEGMAIVVGDIDGAGAEARAIAAGGRAIHVRCDVRQEEDVRAMAGATETYRTTDQAHTLALQARAALDPPSAAKTATATPSADMAPAKKPTAMELAAAKRMMEMTRQQSAKRSPTVSPNRSRDRDKDPGLKR